MGKPSYEINYSWWKNPGTMQWSYEIRLGHIIHGTKIKSGKGYPTKKDAQKEMRKELRKIQRGL